MTMMLATQRLDQCATESAHRLQFPHGLTLLTEWRDVGESAQGLPQWLEPAEIAVSILQGVFAAALAVDATVDTL